MEIRPDGQGFQNRPRLAHDYAPCLGVISEDAEHGAGDRHAVDLLDPSHYLHTHTHSKKMVV